MLSGIAGLDAVLGGGLLHGHSLLLQGTPGSGRTALGLQLLASGALLYGEPGIILAVEQSREQFVREAWGLGLDLQALEARGRIRVIYARRDDLYSSFAERESVALSRIAEAALDLQARRLLVDPGSEFFRLPMPTEDRHRVFEEFIRKLKDLNLTPVLTGDVPADGRDFGPEEAAVDAIVRLDHGPAAFMGGRRRRELEVIKARGQHVLEGRHLFRIEPGRIRVFPCAFSGTLEVYTIEDEALLESRTGQSPKGGGRMTTGVTDLDRLLGGGVWPGSVTLAAGAMATGKTLLASHFAAAGLDQGERVLYVTLGDRASRFLEAADRRGLALTNAASAGALTLLQSDATGLHPLEFVYDLQEQLEASRATRVILDGVCGLLTRASCPDERSCFMEMLGDLFGRRNVTSFLTCRVEENGLLGVASLSCVRQVDNVLYLKLTELSGRLRRMIAVVKTRGEFADPSLMEVVMNGSGVSIADLVVERFPGPPTPPGNTSNGEVQ